MTIRTRLFLSFGLLLFMLAALEGAVLLISHFNETDGLLINLAGRQRMLSQRMAKTLALTVSYRDSGDDARMQRSRSELDQSIQLYDRTIRAFAGGGETVSGSGEPVTIEAILPQDVLEPNVALWDSFLARIRRAAETAAPADVAFVFDNANMLLALSNDVVTALQANADTKNVLLTRVSLSFLGVTVLLFVWLGRSLNRRIVRPIASTSGDLQDLSQRDADLTISVNVTSSDEIGALGRSFNTFVRKLRGLMIEVKQAIEESARANDAVMSSVTNTKSATEEISASTTSMKTQIEKLNDVIDGIAAAINEIAANIASVDNQITNQSAMVEQSTAAITQMIGSLDRVDRVTSDKKASTERLERVATDGKLQLEETSKAFATVVEQVATIQGMADTINAIASQTNLLSMNAAIEAAHAGEAGAGFSVVAEEIRNLAEHAGVSSKEITRTIQEITEQVTTTAELNRQLNTVFGSVTDEVSDTIGAFSEIEQNVSELASGAQEILDAARQINDVTINVRHGSGEINTGIRSLYASSEQVRQVFAHVNDGMGEIDGGIQEIVRSMHTITGQSQTLDRIVATLQQDFGQFKTDGDQIDQAQAEAPEAFFRVAPPQQVDPAAS